LQWSKMTKPALWAAILVFVASSCGPIWSAQSQASPSDGKTEATLATSNKLISPTGKGGTLAVGTVDPSVYVVGPEDSLQISVWREPELTAGVIVRPDGMISMPLLNDVKAVGLKPLELQAIITERLKAFVNDPQVTVIVTGIHSRSVYLIGQVSRQGPYQLNGQKTALQLMADAGGPNVFAKVNSIYIMRRVSGQLMRIPFKYKDALKNPKFDVELQPGDEVIVP
jgi:polysaccharide biosynthesis/export protein